MAEAKKAPWWRKLFFFMGEGMWRLDSDELGFWRRIGVHCARFSTTAFRGFVTHRCGLHAAGLTYFSILAIVPILCLLLLLARTCGADDLIRTKINENLDAQIAAVENAQQNDLAKVLTPDEKAAEEKRQNARGFAIQLRQMSNELIDRIDNFNVGTLGWAGLAMLLWTVISTLGMVEGSFNEIWEVEKPRPIWKRAYLYAFVSVVLPILVAIAMSMPVMKAADSIIDATVGMTDFTKPLSGFLKNALASKTLSFFFTLVSAATAFAFFFGFMPNTKVQRRAAFEGGLITAVLFGLWMKLCAVAQVGIAKSNALYGSFAFIPIILAWIYMSWQIVLLGANMVYALQCVHSRSRNIGN